MNRLVSVAVALSLALALPLSTGGCDKKKQGSARESAAEDPVASTSIVEVYERGQIAWNVDENGQLLARVHDADGGDATRKTSGTIEWTEGGDVRSAKLSFDDKLDALVAQGPVPKDDLNEIRYALVHEGEPVNGSLHVPRAGTAALHAEGEATAKVDVTGAVAPHGGVVQIVGDDRVEIVADDDSDEVRVYVLDASFQPVVVGDRKITLAIGGPKPQVVVLVPDDGGAYFVGHWQFVGQPPRLTVLVKRPGVSHVVIVGWHPGAKLVLAGGPRVKVKVKGVGWNAKGKVKINGGGGPAMVKIDVKEKGPKGKVKIKLK